MSFTPLQIDSLVNIICDINKCKYDSAIADDIRGAIKHSLPQLFSFCSQMYNDYLSDSSLPDETIADLIYPTHYSIVSSEYWNKRTLSQVMGLSTLQY